VVRRAELCFAGQQVAKAAHTPGPWHFDGHGINSSVGERIAKVQHGEPYLTDGGQPRRNERFDADSVLIASAPEMADLLQRWVAATIASLPTADLATETAQLLDRFWRDK
jgi:hypothetical protein